MSDTEKEKKEPSWWQTMPGILTGLAALLTALGGLLTVLHQTDMFKQVTSTASVQLSPTATNPTGASAVAQSPVTQPIGDRPQAQAGHYTFKLLSTTLEPYATDATGQPSKRLLQCLIRVTDVMGISDYVDRSTIRLLVDGSELTPENSINVSVFEKQAVETEALFIIPADADKIELLVGRDGAATAKIPIDLNATMP